jgi:hypothetical protein
MASSISNVAHDIYCKKCGDFLFTTDLAQGTAECPCGGVTDLASTGPEVRVHGRGGGKLPPKTRRRL